MSDASDALLAHRPRIGLLIRPPMRIAVECHAGYRADETPRVLRIGDRRVEVIEVLERWLAPDHRYFKVRGGDGACYIIRHDPYGEQWELTLREGSGR